MGGNVFPGKTRRYERQEYEALELEVVAKLQSSIFDDESGLVFDRCMPLQYYRNKETFGDMDIVVNSSILKPNWINFVVKEFNLGHGDWSKNGNVLSIVYKAFQIDLITQPEENYSTALDYFDWNDLGNFVGRIAHKFGLKFGHNGTYLTVRDGDNQIGTILVTKNTERLFSLLDLNFDVWSYGFDDMEEVYRWVSSSKYFNKEIYAFENRNHAARTRDKKRANYNGFLTWMESQENLPAYPYEDMTSQEGYSVREPFFTDLIVPAFPHVKFELDKLMQANEERKAFKAVFNGQICMEVTGLIEKELGEFMAFARDQFDKNPDLKKAYLGFHERNQRMIISSLKGHMDNGWEYGKVPQDEAKSRINAAWEASKLST